MGWLTCKADVQSFAKMQSWGFTEQISQKILAEHQKKQEIMASIYSGKWNRK